MVNLRVVAVTAALIAAVSPTASVQARNTLPPERPSPPGQVRVVSVNSRLAEILDRASFGRLFEFVRAVRTRPTAFDGGDDGATGMPDVIVFQEMRFSNLEIVRKLMQQRSGFDYQIVALDGAMSKFLVNMTTMTLVGDPLPIDDPCRPGTPETSGKFYSLARFTENATGAPVTIAGIHLKAKYQETGLERCRERNIEAIRAAVAADPGGVIVAGDFNTRAMETPQECDPDELSAPLEWWSSMTAPTDGSRAFTDAVVASHRARGEVLNHEWTFERFGQVTLCDGSIGLKRTRLDYIFVSGAEVVEAHADHPGWAGEVPGTADPDNYKYSDHRWVEGRFVLTGPAQPLPPVVTPAAGGVMGLSWQPQEGVQSWILYRAAGDRPYRTIATLTPDITAFEDANTFHGTRYRYSLAPVGFDGGQGAESFAAEVVADARGPRVVATRPHSRIRDFPRGDLIHVFFDERVVEPRASTIRLFSKGRRIGGFLRQVSPRHLVFDPFRKLRDDRRHTIVVGLTRDALGNLGQGHSVAFST